MYQKLTVKSHSFEIAVFLSYASKPNAVCIYSQTLRSLKMQALSTNSPFMQKFQNPAHKHALHKSPNSLFGCSSIWIKLSRVFSFYRCWFNIFETPQSCQYFFTVWSIINKLMFFFYLEVYNIEFQALTCWESCLGSVRFYYYGNLKNMEVLRIIFPSIFRRVCHLWLEITVLH